jgi:hypothetical protein
MAREVSREKGLSARSVLTWIKGGPEATQHGSEACRQAPILSRSVRPIGAPRDGCERLSSQLSGLRHFGRIDGVRAVPAQGVSTCISCVNEEADDGRRVILGLDPGLGLAKLS